MNDFRLIPGHPGYFVSESGAVVSTAWDKQRVLAQWVNSNGYLTCKVGSRHLPIHRAVALVFVPNPDGLSDVNHIDGNKQNNTPANLEWCSRSDNTYHALRGGLHPVEETPVVATDQSTGEQRRFPSQAEAGRAGFQQPNINKCLKGARASHKGYTWRYEQHV